MGATYQVRGQEEKKVSDAVIKWDDVAYNSRMTVEWNECERKGS
jgi:hypothetical protein